MRATAGGSPDRGGYAGLMVLFVIAGLVIAGVMLAPDLVIQVKARNRSHEDKTLLRLRQALVRTAQRTQTFPAATNWSTAILPFTGLDQSEVEQVFPGFPTDTNTARVFLVDPGLTSGLLPFTQGNLGLTNAQTNLVGSYARVMLVSNTKRSLTLPVTSGSPSSNLFYQIWNWAYDPSTKSPPTGFPGSWTGFGEFLQVQRLNLANLFFNVTMNNLMFGVGETNAASTLVTNQTTYQFLGGTRLVLAQTNRTVQRYHVVTRDVSFDFSTNTSSGPILWLKFAETSGTLATNAGSLGSSANATNMAGVTLNVAGPRSPTYAGYSSTNTAASFDGSNDYLSGTNNLLNTVTGFTIAGWIKPASAGFDNMDLFGEMDVATFAFTTASKVELWCNNGTKKLHYIYPYASGAWHHIAGVGDGSNMYIYVDGVEVSSRVYATTDYGASSNPFTVGANTTGSGNYFNGSIDEVLVYDRALSAVEIALIYAGSPP